LPSARAVNPGCPGVSAQDHISLTSHFLQGPEGGTACSLVPQGGSPGSHLVPWSTSQQWAAGQGQDTIHASGFWPHTEP
jgi:hypothetical protein